MSKHSLTLFPLQFRHFRSSVNHREALTARPPEPEPDPSLKELWLLIRKLVDHISQSVLQKQRRAKLDLQ